MNNSLIPVGNLSGTIQTTPIATVYDGEYEVTPLANREQVLETKNKMLKDNIIVKEIPYHETTNLQNGTTVFIGKKGEIYGN